MTPATADPATAATTAPAIDPADFAHRYGPWALVAGASEGVPGVATPDEVVAEAIANLANGPTWFAGEQVREGARRLSTLPRSEAVRTMLERVSVMDAPAPAAGAEVAS